ncbi:hypothetical protein HYX58_02515 [Candidatus Dependentiae bacterium]|nr:hypothetical protein [Candidatus Dependentiae bacterium]
MKKIILALLLLQLESHAALNQKDKELACLAVFTDDRLVTDLFGKKAGTALLKRAKLPLEHKDATTLSPDHFSALDTTLQKNFEKLFPLFEEIIFTDSAQRIMFSVRPLPSNCPEELMFHRSDILDRYEKKYIDRHKLIILSYANGPSTNLKPK